MDRSGRCGEPGFAVDFRLKIRIAFSPSARTQCLSIDLRKKCIRLPRDALAISRSKATNMCTTYVYLHDHNDMRWNTYTHTHNSLCAYLKYIVDEFDDYSQIHITNYRPSPWGATRNDYKAFNNSTTWETADFASLPAIQAWLGGWWSGLVRSKIGSVNGQLLKLGSHISHISQVFLHGAGELSRMNLGP